MAWFHIRALTILLLFEIRTCASCVNLKPVRVALNTNATLPCSNGSEPKTSISTVSWSVVKGTLETLILHFPPGYNVSTSVSTSVATRAGFAEHPISGGTSLNLSNVQYSDTQWYRCNLTTGQNRSCFDVKLQVQKPQNMTGFTSDRSPGSDPAKLSNAMVTTIALTTLLMVITAILLGLTMRYRRHAASHSNSAPEDPLRHMYEAVDHIAMTTNTLYTPFTPNEEYTTFKKQQKE
ncbi:hypothetical protein DPEC_G00139540 [Dallia pectoralis]|uniref:Uncharacterized protein n=1 Tax=Dallia pectoralis TaxID=75939 RepID=A0ACC2GMA0_DALPE|nr:hypothetical protein DPEC_G00139540 [Dallia pectoralis]